MAEDQRNRELRREDVTQGGFSRRSPETGKKDTGSRPHWNSFDFLLIAVIAAAVVLLIFGGEWFGIGSADFGESATFSFEVRFENTDARYADAIALGAPVCAGDGSAVIGTVSEIVSVREHKSPVLGDIDATGNAVCRMVSVPGKIDLTVKIVAEGTLEPGVGYSAGEIAVRIGGTMVLRFPEYYGEGICTALSADTTAEGEER